jgi:hypothetical protein
MVFTLRSLAALSIAALVFALSAGCGPGLSTDDAKLRCNQEQVARAQCFDTKVFAQCQSCFEECGDDCVPMAACPVKYSCSGDLPAK